MRWILVALAATTFFGCESRAREAEKKAAEATVAVERYEADELRPIQEAMQALKAELAAKESEASQTTAHLSSLRQELASLWRGDEAKLRAKVRSASVPANLVPFLEKAQSEAGTSTVEQRFKAAVSSADLATLGTTVAGWEYELSPEAMATAEPVTQAKCEREVVSLSCEKLATDESPAPVRFLCRAKDHPVTFIASDEDGDFAVRRLEPEARGAVRVIRRLAPDWWVIRRELTERGEMLSADRGTRVAAKTWVGVVQLSGYAATERLAIAGESAGKAVAFVPADLDGDGLEEVVEIAPDLVRAVHYGPKAGGVELWTEEDTCRRVASRTDAPLAPAKERCAETIRKLKEADEAAERLAADIQRAPPPGKTVEALRDAALACDATKALALLSKRLVEDIERNAKEKGESVDATLQKACREEMKAELKEGLPFLRVGKTEVKGSHAFVELTFAKPDCTDCASRSLRVPLSFEGTWKVDSDEKLSP